MLTNHIVNTLSVMTGIPESWTAWLVKENHLIQNSFYLFGMVGVIMATSTFVWNVFKDRNQKLNQIYDSLDDKYLEYLKWCFENVDLDVYDISNNKVGHNQNTLYTPSDVKKELIAFTVLLNIFERAFLAYNDPGVPEDIKDRQWSGWHEYIKAFADRENFKKAIETLYSGSFGSYDKKFEKYLRDVIGLNIPLSR